MFDNILAESPSFWIGEGKFLEDLRSYSGKWPSKVFLAMGSQEYSGSRVHKEPKFDKWMVEYVSIRHMPCLLSPEMVDGLFPKKTLKP